MEDFAPSAVATATYIRQQVERAGLYLGISACVTAIFTPAPVAL